MKYFFKEFKEFAMRGNVIDMAIGIVIGSSFSAIVTSLVNDILTPIIAALTSDVTFSDLKLNLKTINGNIITLNYGSFIQTVIDFVIIAFVMFLVVRTFNRINKLKKTHEEENKPVKSAELLELEKIREVLEKKGEK